MSDPEIQAEYRAARPEEYAQVLGLWAAVWSAGPYFRAYLEGDPWLREPYCLIARVDGRIVSAVHICRRPVRYGSRNLVLGGIANVATLAEYRRQGHSSELLRRAVEVMERERFDFSTLGTGVHGHYARHGWVRCPGRSARLVFADGTDLPAADPDIGPMAVAEWIDEAPPVYAAYNAALPIFLERSLAYWNGWIRIRAAEWRPDRNLLLGLRSHGVLEGYAVVSLPRKAGEGAGVEEGASVTADAMRRLLSAASRAARLAGAPRLDLRLPQRSLASLGLEDLGRLDSSITNGGMIRGFALDPAALTAITGCYGEGAATWWGPDDF